MKKRATADQQDLELGHVRVPSDGPVECLGRTFESEGARREFFTQALREKLQESVFRQQDGFPQGTVEDILRMSEPPFYTACPNPFLDDFVRRYGRPDDVSELYQREPFAVDTSVGKTDALYKAHGYHTKVPHLAIVPSILHYTKPGDVVLDGFAGSGMTGVAAQWCASAPAEYRDHLELEAKRDGRSAPEWGARAAVLNDLSTAATFISAGNVLRVNADEFEREGLRILEQLESELGWMYRTRHSSGSEGRINYTVWSEVFTCGECASEIVFLLEAFDIKTKSIREQFRCPHCRVSCRKNDLELSRETVLEPLSRQPTSLPKRVPVLINYSVGKQVFEKPVDEDDLAVLARIEGMPFPAAFPQSELPDCQMTRVGRMATTRTKRVHHMFLPRARHTLARIWAAANGVDDVRLRHALQYFFEQGIWTLSILNRYRPSGYSQVAQYLTGVFYVPSQMSEVSPSYVYQGKLSRLTSVFDTSASAKGPTIVSTGTCANLPCGPDTVDYIFTDPPFGENIYYADLNFLVEAFHKVWTDPSPEAIVDRVRRKAIPEYHELMRGCFSEYFRVLKPGRWMTVVFSNSSNAVWRSIQESLGSVGFVVADVRTLDKQQVSFRQATSSAVKQDLVISAYKPTESLARQFALGEATEDGAWAFVAEHLRNVPIFVPTQDTGEVVAERTAQMLHDRMIAFHVQRGLAVPLSGPGFEEGLRTRFPERDGMFFLSHQVADYDRKRAGVAVLKQLELFVTDESSAIRWVRQQLQAKPRRLQDLTPEFTKQLQAWERHEVTIELRELLEQNFVRYDGDGPVPSQIHQYLSTNFKDLRNLSKTDPSLVRKAKGCWYVPDSAKAVDLEKLRHAGLLKEFQVYVESAQKRLKVFRTEAVRSGFKDAYDRRDYDLIVRVADKLPETVLQEDEQLLMYYDVASTRLGR